MEFRGIQPERLLAVFLGASTYEESPNLADGSAFYNSANDLRNYLRNTYAVPRKNIKWLFDDSHSPSDQLNELARFLSERCAALKVDGNPAEDLLIYYVGHGLFAREQYCLAIRATKENNEAFSSIRGADLAGVVKEYARLLRRFLIFDCCFSAAIYQEFQFQTPPMTIARAQVIRELPLKGTSLLCSSNAEDPSFVSSRLGRTMFSDALIMSLTSGDISLGNPMSFSELGDLVRENLKTKYDGSWARPEVHSPDQREGDIAHLPMFPNAAYRASSTGLEQEKQAQARPELERLEQEKQAQAQAEQERLEREQNEKAKAPFQQVRKEADQRSEREKQEQAQAEYERLEREKQAQAQAEQERLEREQKARTAKLGQQLYQKLMSEDLMGEERIRRLRTVLELSPDHMHAMRDLAAALHGVKRDYEAAEYLKCAIHMGLRDEAALREYAEIQTSIKNREIEQEEFLKDEGRKRLERERVEQEAKAQAERERLEREKNEKAKARLKQVRQDAEQRLEQDKQQAEQKRLEREKKTLHLAEQERLEREKQTRDQAEQEAAERNKPEEKPSGSNYDPTYYSQQRIAERAKEAAKRAEVARREQEQRLKAEAAQREQEERLNAEIANQEREESDRKQAEITRQQLYEAVREAREEEEEARQDRETQLRKAETHRKAKTQRKTSGQRTREEAEARERAETERKAREEVEAQLKAAAQMAREQVEARYAEEKSEKTLEAEQESESKLKTIIEDTEARSKSVKIVAGSIAVLSTIVLLCVYWNSISWSEFASILGSLVLILVVVSGFFLLVKIFNR